MAHDRVYKELRTVWEGKGPRSNEVIRITKDYMKFNEEKEYYNIRIWYHSADKGQLLPTSRGFTLTPQEFITFADALQGELKHLEGSKQRINIQTTLSTKSEGVSEAK